MNETGPQPSPAAAGEVRLKISSDTAYSLNPQGVYLRNNSGSLQLEGASSQQFFLRLLPHLQEGLSVEQLCRSLSPEKSQAVKSLLEALCRKRFLYEESGRNGPGAQVWERFLSSLLPNPPAAADALGAVHLRLAAPPRLLSDLEQCLLAAGFAQPVVAARGGPTGAAEKFFEGLPAAGAGALVVAQAGQGRSIEPLARAARRAKAVMLVALLNGEEAVIGPVQAEMPQGNGGCWHCLLCHMEDSAGQDGPKAEKAHGKAIARPGLLERYLARQLALEAFHIFAATGRSRTMRGAVVIDGPTAASKTGPVSRHPGCPLCSDSTLGLWTSPSNRALAVLSSLPVDKSPAPPARSADILEDVGDLRGSRFGMLRELGEANYLQLPLNRSEAWSAAADSPFVASGLDFQEARRRAVAAALQAACSRGADPLIEGCRNALEGAGYPLAVRQGRDAEGQSRLWCWGFRLPERRLVLTPWSDYRMGKNQAALGVGWGTSSRELVHRAVLAAVALQLESAAMAGRRLAASIDLQDLQSPQARRYWKILKRLGAEPEAAQLIHPLGTPTVWAAVGSRPGVLAVEPTLREAAEECLRRLVQALQAQTRGEPMDSGVRLLPTGPPERRPAAADVEWEKRQDLIDLLSEMKSRQIRGTCVPYLEIPLPKRSFRAAGFRFDPGAGGHA